MINVNTLNAALEGIEKVASSFQQSFLLVGNHDLYFREKRTVSSMAFARHVKNIQIITNPVQMDDVTLLPWLVGDEKDHLPNPTRYTFAHLEMSGFMMNAKSVMPESDHALSIDRLDRHGTVFTGHFHMRQRLRNVIYTGNVMPFDFSDNWDAERGAMFLEWGGEPEFVSWPDQPLFRTARMSDIIGKENYDSVLCPKATVRLTMDVDLTYEQAAAFKEHFMDHYRLRKLEIVPVAVQEEARSGSEVVFQSIDQIVTDGLLSVQSQGMKSEKLVNLYRSLS